MKSLLLIFIFSAFTFLVSCKTADKAKLSSTLAAVTDPDKDNIAVILVHGWGKTPRRPNFIWRLKIKPYTDLTRLRESFKSAGYNNVHVLDYDDELSTKDMSKTVAAQIQSIIARANNPQLKIDVIGHSLGQFVSLKAILEYPISRESSEPISSRVRLFVGLAGAVRGQDVIRPCRIFPNQCGGAEILSPFYRATDNGAQEIKTLFSEYFVAIDGLKKCSLFARGDEIVDSPYNAGSFSGLGLNPENIKDLEIPYGGGKFHKDVKDNPTIIGRIFSDCHSLVRQGPF
jgi:pimeloyl-ACP methyl ester carboxylesterase